MHVYEWAEEYIITMNIHMCMHRNSAKLVYKNVYLIV